MVGKIMSFGLRGLEGQAVYVEADVRSGVPNVIFIGYLASEVRESKERVMTAIRNLGIPLPPKKITVNLSPADFKKEGTSYDLAIAVSVLLGYEKITAKSVRNCAFIGELGLDGNVREIPGVLSYTDEAVRQGIKRLYLPSGNLREASTIDGIELVGISDLGELMMILSGQKTPMRMPKKFQREIPDDEDLDFSEVNGQQILRRAAEVAAAGKHNFLMIGPYGSGKTMIAKRMITILPELEKEEMIRISKIYSAAGLLSEKTPLIRRRPFRSPHYTISASALTGGGNIPKPGEVSLASGGILFLDELAEMQRNAIEVLRQPLEEGTITIARNQWSFQFPADFQLVAAMNPCPCGNYPDPNKCTCTRTQRMQYLSRISRPFLDRIDICAEASRVRYQDITSKQKNESSSEIRKRVLRAREIQKERFRGTGITTNSKMGTGDIRKYCRLNRTGELYMKSAFNDFELSARSYHKILKVARTVADLEGKEQILKSHLAEAISYARIRNNFWGGHS